MRSTHLLAVTRWTSALASLLATTLATGLASAQQPRTSASVPRSPAGWEITGVPALNYDADEGFGYGAILELYDYGRGVQPYRMTIQPTVFLTTEGRRDVTLFVDAPALLPDGWRLS